MRLLHLVPSVDPQGGGVIEGVRRLHDALTELGHSGDVVSLDSPDAACVRAYPGKVVATGPSVSSYGYNERLLPWLKEHAGGYDAVIVNGLWQYVGLAARRALHASGTPYFVYSHGMLDPWFKRTYPLKHLKKWLYWPWGEYRVLRDASAVVFTCEEERLLARQSFWLYRCREVVGSYGTSTPPQDAERLSDVFLSSFPELRNKRLLLFLGRIHEKKGCDLLIEAFAQVASKAPDVHLVMAGPGDDALVRQLQARARSLGLASRISWPGMLSGDLKWGAFHACEVFCLPSHQENFGIAVAEAMACSRPVLISDKVNIWREIDADHAGFVESDTLEGTAALLRRWLAATPAELDAMRAAALRSFEQRFRMEQVASTLVDIICTHAPHIR
ncbi:Mannosylfructose-phosphate synthase [Variovorax sp. PBS-H4]|uniref:glycosyltransferase n=1 Tax=Variovorax sp. PBS-H4 TaxID=434008 RepID=UPI001318504A|nr:glycosyltransferase [Variovorax sp. PBS-H4]VTU39896.1 Mannosylfructose-phosphate synthase [Variovorax sp. PBS-H4]